MADDMSQCSDKDTRNRTPEEIEEDIQQRPKVLEAHGLAILPVKPGSAAPRPTEESGGDNPPR